MTDVVIAGIGQTPVGEHWGVSLKELALNAIENLLEDVGGLRPQALYVGNMFASRLSDQTHLGAMVADFAGYPGIESMTIESAGASGGAALRAGYLALLSGEVDVVMVLGVEKMSDRLGSSSESAMATTSDSDYEAAQGITSTAQAAILMQRYLHEFNAPRDSFAGFAVTAHTNGTSNTHAMFRRVITPENYSKASVISDPLNMFDVAPYADGAAAVMLSRSELLPPKSDHSMVRISGSSLVTDTLALHDRPDPLTFNAVRLSVERACKQASTTIEEIDLFELYDSYSIYALLSLEGAGYAPKGKGWKLAQNGMLNLQGKLPISTFGGLKARGNPGGATGIYQVVEAVQQLRGEAGDNQVVGARRAMVQCIGGPASSAATHILELIKY